MTETEVLQAIAEVYRRTPPPKTAADQARLIVEIRHILRQLKGTIQ